MWNRFLIWIRWRPEPEPVIEYIYSDELSYTLRETLKPLTKFRQFRDATWRDRVRGWFTK